MGFFRFDVDIPPPPPITKAEAAAMKTRRVAAEKVFRAGAIVNP